MKTLSREGRAGWAAGLLLLAQAAQAGEVAIEQASFSRAGDAWQVAVTLRHGDTGWDHYADGWRVVDEAGQVLGHRTLYHPHVNEQPFTRSDRVVIPAGVQRVFVEAHDTVHGWSSQRLEVRLDQPAGPGYRVQP
jgi:hypothetical protein